MSRIEGARVLVVDDDDTIRAVVRRLAEIAGAQVTEAESGEAALRALYDLRPDIVVPTSTFPASTAGRCSSACASSRTSRS